MANKGKNQELCVVEVVLRKEDYQQLGILAAKCGSCCLKGFLAQLINDAIPEARQEVDADVLKPTKGD